MAQGLALERRRTHASRQAAWRGRLRSASGTMLSVIVLLAFGAMYLAVNDKVSRAGRDLMVLEAQREEIYRRNNELRARVAMSSSPAELLERARALGFRPAEASEIEFLEVEGYVPDHPFQAPIPPSLPADEAGMLSPAFTETLGSWLSRLLSGSALP